MNCILLYSKKEQLPVGLFYNVTELSSYLHRNYNSVASSLCRFRQGIRDCVKDSNGKEYEPFDVELEN